VTFTNPTGDTVDATLAQKVYVAYEIVEDIEKPNLMGMMFYLDVPEDLAKDGAVIVQYAQYRKKFEWGDKKTV
jgi:hypothetical protein